RIEVERAGSLPQARRFSAEIAEVDARLEGLTADQLRQRAIEAIGTVTGIRIAGVANQRASSDLAEIQNTDARELLSRDRIHVARWKAKAGHVEIGAAR